MNNIEDILARQQYIAQNMPKKDHFDKGIMRAIESAKQSLSMDDDQSDRAMRNSILTFGKEMQTMPKTRGFMANFAQAGKAMIPAIETHDAYEDKAKNENKQMMQYAQQLRAQEEAQAAQLEQQSYLRNHAEDQLNHQRETLDATRDHHDMMHQAALAKAQAAGTGNSHNLDEHGLVDGKFAPFQDKKDRVAYTKKLQAANLVKMHLEDARKVLVDFKKNHGGELMSQPLVGARIGKNKSIFGQFSKNPKTLADAEDRVALDQAIGTLAIKFEKELKGGILTGDMVGRFQSMGLVPVATDSLPVMEKKLKGMLDLAEKEGEMAKKSLVNNYHYEASQEVASEPTDKRTDERTDKHVELKNSKGETIYIQPSNSEHMAIANKKGFYTVDQIKSREAEKAFEEYYNNSGLNDTN